ncbi:hypothetical protein D3C76_835770 [compost metagenome]
MRLGSRILGALQSNLVQHNGVASSSFYQFDLDTMGAKRLELLVKSSNVSVCHDCHRDLGCFGGDRSRIGQCLPVLILFDLLKPFHLSAHCGGLLGDPFARFQRKLLSSGMRTVKLHSVGVILCGSLGQFLTIFGERLDICRLRCNR